MEKELDKFRFFNTSAPEVKKPYEGILPFIFQPKNVANVLKYTCLALAFYFGSHVFTGLMDSNEKHSVMEQQQKQEKRSGLIKSVTQYSQKDINQLVAFLEKNKTHEIERVNVLYWKMQYIAQTSPKEMNSETLASIVSNLDDLAKKVNNHYDQRSFEFLKLYNKSRAGSYDFTTTSYDGQNVYNLFNSWMNAVSINKTFTYDDIDAYDTKYSAYLSDKLALAKYLDEHKEDMKTKLPLFK